jgi:DNA polymerase-3 subunit epsilon
MYLPDFLDGFDRLVAFDAETTGKRTPDAEFIRKQPFAGRAPGIIIEVGLVARRRGLAQGRDVKLQGQPGWADRPRGHQDPRHSARRSQEGGPRFPTILPKLKDFVGESPIAAHAFKNERDFLDYEFARAKAIEWARAPTLRSATFARRSCSRSFSQAPASR